MKSRAILSYVFVGLPGGCLIFMGMLMFNAVLGLLLPTSQRTMLVILCLTALIVGLMARWMRPYHGLGSAVAAGLVAAGIILFLWLSAARNTEPGPVFGPGGILASVAFSTLGGWVFPRLFRRSK
jgi:predicted membrane protein